MATIFGERLVEGESDEVEARTSSDGDDLLT